MYISKKKEENQLLSTLSPLELLTIKCSISWIMRNAVGWYIILFQENNCFKYMNAKFLKHCWYCCVRHFYLVNHSLVLIRLAESFHIIARVISVYKFSNLVFRDGKFIRHTEILYPHVAPFVTWISLLRRKGHSPALFI